MSDDYRIGSDEATGRVWVEAPYSGMFFDAAHELGGRASATDRGTIVWTFPNRQHEAVETLCAQLWPEEASRVERIYRFVTPRGGKGWSDEVPTIDGMRLLTLGQGWRGEVTHQTVTEVLEDTLIASPSGRGAPRMRGVLRVRCRVRPDVVVTWGGAQPGTVTTELGGPA